MPTTIPNDAADIATFGASDVTEVFNADVIVNLDSLVFSPGAPPYTITEMDNIELYGSGIVNNSGTMQSFVAGGLFFFNSATAGKMIHFSNVDGFISFNDTASAGSVTIDLTSDMAQAHVDFFTGSTAADATINASAGSNVGFLDGAHGGNATFNLTTEASVIFTEGSNAEHATGNCIGGDQYFGAYILFQEAASAGEGLFTAFGGSTNGEKGGFVEFDQTTTADDATFVIHGSLGAGLTAASLDFYDSSTAANATITANGGVDGSAGGAIFFAEKSKGGKASVTLNGNGELDISGHTPAGVAIGSLAGNGLVFLGGNQLTIGSNNQNTRFAGTIQDGGSSGGSGGSLSKSGSGSLALSRANSYTGGTTVSAGILRAANKNGSATGTGPVNVNGGTLGGEGTIAGATTIGTGSGAGAFLAPALGTNKQPTFIIQSALTFNSDATYTCTFKARRNEARTDEVIAHGVTINGATLNLSGQIQGTLRPGLTLMLLSNTSADPINGTFSNLPEGAIVNVDGTNFQASYTGGDGNDLTLTVVP